MDKHSTLVKRFKAKCYAVGLVVRDDNKPATICYEAAGFRRYQDTPDMPGFSHWAYWYPNYPNNNPPQD